MGFRFSVFRFLFLLCLNVECRIYAPRWQSVRACHYTCAGIYGFRTCNASTSKATDNVLQQYDGINVSCNVNEQPTDWLNACEKGETRPKKKKKRKHYSVLDGLTWFNFHRRNMPPSISVGLFFYFVFFRWIASLKSYLIEATCRGTFIFLCRRNSNAQSCCLRYNALTFESTSTADAFSLHLFSGFSLFYSLTHDHNSVCLKSVNLDHTTYLTLTQ